jgi:stage V sporulation protein R
VKEAAFEHRDDGFIAQYLSPKVIRDMRMFAIHMKHSSEDEDVIPAIVSEIHDDVGYKNIRNLLAQSMERINFVPQIAVVGAAMEGDRTLTLQYVPYKGRTLDLEDADLVTDHIDSLWGYPVELNC